MREKRGKEKKSLTGERQDGKQQVGGKTKDNQQAF